MLIRNLRSLFDGLEPPTGRLESVLPDVIEEKEHKVIIPEKFKDDIQMLQDYCGVEFKTSYFCIELKLSELLDALPRDRCRKDAYDKLVKFLADDIYVQLMIHTTRIKITMWYYLS